MAGYFELVDVPDGGYRIRMLDGAGSLMAVSVTFPTKRAAVAWCCPGPRNRRHRADRDRSAGGQAAPVGPLSRVTQARTAGGAGRGTSLSGGSLAAGKESARPITDPPAQPPRPGAPQPARRPLPAGRGTKRPCCSTSTAR